MDPELFDEVPYVILCMTMQMSKSSVCLNRTCKHTTAGMIVHMSADAILRPSFRPPRVLRRHAS